MKLSELSAEYRSDEAAIRQRIHQLRHQARQAGDPKTQLALQHLIAPGQGTGGSDRTLL